MHPIHRFSSLVKFGVFIIATTCVIFSAAVIRAQPSLAAPDVLAPPGNFQDGISTTTPEATAPAVHPTQIITPTIVSDDPAPYVLTATPVSTTTNPITGTVTLTPTITSALPFTDTEPITSHVYLPIVNFPGAYLPETRALYCSSPNTPIPDGTSAGVSQSITITDLRVVTDLDVYVEVSHTWVGDLTVTLTHNQSGKTAILIDRPGVPATVTGCGNNNIKAILDDEMSAKTEKKCETSPAAVAGSYIPQEKLATFDADLFNGTWVLNVADHSTNDQGSLKSWCLYARGSLNPAPPPAPPAIPSLPNQVIINGVTGQPQALHLDCESRSAVDWANYFGKSINEYNFFSSLPSHTNPDKGFVGDVHGTWGQIPPNDYGVHAEPIAAELRNRGLSAYAHKYMSWDQLRLEISEHRPVIVWIVGAANGQLASGAPVYFTPPDGLTTIVARYEHTVVVTGYTSNQVYYLNGGTIYAIPVTKFLDSWSAMGNMAVSASP